MYTHDELDQHDEGEKEVNRREGDVIRKVDSLALGPFKPDLAIARSV